MSPELLASYLQALPDSVYQIELRDGDFTIKLNMVAPDPKIQEQAERTAEAFSVSEGTQVPPELRDYFPQLAKV